MYIVYILMYHQYLFLPIISVFLEDCLFKFILLWRFCDTNVIDLKQYCV